MPYYYQVDSCEWVGFDWQVFAHQWFNGYDARDYAEERIRQWKTKQTRTCSCQHLEHSDKLGLGCLTKGCLCLETPALLKLPAPRRRVFL